MTNQSEAVVVEDGYLESGIVPFGKYKGQPIEALVTDQEYCAWISAQPWFKERYARIYNIVFNGPQKRAQETPEHNEMQLGFLQDGLCLALAQLLRPNYRWHVELEMEKVPAFARKAVKKSPELFNVSIQPPQVGQRTFEYHGWDVAFVASTGFCRVEQYLEPTCTCDGEQSVGRSWRGKTLTWDICHTTECPANICSWPWPVDTTATQFPIFVECKPELGDDFPVVLRQVLRQTDRARLSHESVRCVVVRRFAFERVAWDDVSKMFEASGIALLTIDDLRTC